MKKAFSAIIALFLFVNLSIAQEDGAKLAKSASKALTAYNLDPTGNKGKLEEARQKIDQALQTAEAQALGSAWQTKGEIYGTITQQDFMMRNLNPKHPLSGENTALEAFTGFKKAYELSVKKFEKQDALKGIADNLQATMTNIGAELFEKKEYAKAFASFNAVLEAHEILKANKEKSILDDKVQYENQVYYAALSAKMAGNCKDAAPIYTKLLAEGTAKAEYYVDLYDCKIALGDEAGAEKTLAEGRQKFPEDASLLFSEINDYLKKGRLSELTGRLEKAIEKEPTNVGLYVTLGSIYDNLYQKALEEKRDADASSNFDLAKKQYEKAISIDPKMGDAYYSLGALYYNKAAFKTKELNALPEDYSAAGLKKFEAMKNEVMTMFDQALPFFQKAESIDPNEQNTLIALKEIYTRKEDDLALEFKKRLDTIQGGGKNASSHFKQ